MIKYEWQNLLINEAGDDGPWNEVRFGRLPNLSLASDGPDKHGTMTELRLVRWQLDSCGGVIDRADLYVVNGKLPKTFWRNGAKVPQRYHDMLARKIKRGK